MFWNDRFMYIQIYPLLNLCLFFFQALSNELQEKTTQLEILKGLQDKGCEKTQDHAKVFHFLNQIWFWEIFLFFLIFFSPFFRLWVAIVHLRMVPIKLVRCTYLSLKNWTSSDYNFQFHEKMSLTKYYPIFELFSLFL